jgi:Acyl-coenzyme A:6-aminopenicillanic acid acyl-transferase
MFCYNKVSLTMKQTYKKRQILFVITFSVLMIFSCMQKRYKEIITVQPEIDTSIFNRIDNTPDFNAMLASFSKVDNLYIMTFHGNFDGLIAYHHQQIMKYFENQARLDVEGTYCSLFKYRDKTGKIYFGRNFDNRDTDLLIGLFIPDSGYISIGFIPLIELKFDKNNPFNPDLKNHRLLLLHSAAVTVDGMNEKGVVVSVASVGKQEVIADTTKSYRFLLHLKRNILDHASDVSSAVEIAAAYNVFDNSLHHISHHLLIADASGKSVVLEWHDGQMQLIENPERWQIVTNTRMFARTDDALSTQCSRFRRIYNRLKSAPDTLDWRQCMDILGYTGQYNQLYYFDSGPMRVSTQWSAVFEINDRTVTICSQQDFEKAYRFELHDKAYYMQNVN